MLPHEPVVFPDAFPQGAEPLVEDKLFDAGVPQVQPLEKFRCLCAQLVVEVEDVRGTLNEAQVPVRLQSAELRAAQETQALALRLAPVFQDLGDDRELLTLVVPSRDTLGQGSIKVVHPRASISLGPQDLLWYHFDIIDVERRSS